MMRDVHTFCMHMPLCVCVFVQELSEVFRLPQRVPWPDTSQDAIYSSAKAPCRSLFFLRVPQETEGTPEVKRFSAFQASR